MRTAPDVPEPAQYGATPPDGTRIPMETYDRSSQLGGMFHKQKIDGQSHLGRSKGGAQSAFLQPLRRPTCRTLPELLNRIFLSTSPGAQSPQINDGFGNADRRCYAVTATGYSAADNLDAGQFLRRELLSVRGVADVEILGQPADAVFFQPSSQILKALGAPTAAILDAVANGMPGRPPAQAIKVAAI
ncbi:MAG: hypothetical protein NXH97_12925 [Rhodobacteraceae bacterium]|nr:hypothetical protein [Paracoccaceae bacterium]